MEGKILKSTKTAVGQLVRVSPRAAIDGVWPEIDCGRFPIKRVIGERLDIQANIYADGHDELNAVVLYRPEKESSWREAEMKLVENDRWQGAFKVEQLGRYVYTLVAWVDKFGSWRRGLLLRVQAGQDVSLDLLVGADLVASAANTATGSESKQLADFAAKLRELSTENPEIAVHLAEDPALASLMTRNRDRRLDTQYEKELTVVVDREKAVFSTWYEMFPRSCTSDPQRQGTLRDSIQRLDYVAHMGFDVLYLPPIHPIGLTERKGKNNSIFPALDDPGSPWAIGSKDGGHKAIDPNLGALRDLKELQREAAKRGIELALDVAYQCSPDHPYVQDHREWFRERPDGTIQYAENPPKRYQDIYPFDFESDHAAELWEELKGIVIYWIEQGIRIFRVDNPHTKPFAFWEWLINDIKSEYPDVIFLSEAFTRPSVMYRLAKLGFTESYTYFTWKNTKAEIIQYLTEINRPFIREFFRPNLWPNTPDILNAYLQYGGRPAFAARLILAGTLAASYGIYGPAFELQEHKPIREGSEEYLDSEKYQIRVWNIDDPNSLKDLITHVNAIRRSSPALQGNGGLHFHVIENDQLIAYSRVSEDRSDLILVIVNLDPRNIQSGWIEVALDQFRLGSDESYQVHDLLTDASYVWHGSRNFIQLNPSVLPAHIFRVRPIG
jgi:starch synthase (maltosyl-transferring)